MTKKNILIISTHYPPVQKIGTQRIYSFAKYLDKDKYNIFVLTLDTGQPHNSIHNLDNVVVFREKNKSVLKRANFNKRTNRVWHYLKAAWNLFLEYCFGDESMGWAKSMHSRAKEIIETHKIDLVISSFPPLDPHIIALELKKLKPKIKWIADMRDPMSYCAYTQAIVQNKLRKYEIEILKWADALITVSKPILKDFKKLAQNKYCLFKEIRNGYDFEISPVRTEPKNEVFSIAYFGSIYKDRSPINLFKALEKVHKINKIHFKLDFYGVMKPIDIPSNLAQCIHFHDKLQYEECLNMQEKADLLLLIIPNNSEKGVYTGKLFEYLGSLRPILGLVPKDDVAAKLILEANAGYIAENEDIQGIEEKIIEAYNDWENDKPFCPNIEVIKKHHRKEQAKRLEYLIDEVLGN